MSSSNASSPIELWAAVPYLADLKIDVIRALAARATPKHYPANAIIFGEGEPVAGLYMIEQGTIKISRFSSDGREHILHFLQRGDTFNDVAALDGGPNPASAIAFDDAIVWRINRRDMQDVADRYPALAWALVESIARRARHLLGVVEDLSMRNVRGRVAHLLLEQAKANASHDVPRLLTQEEMAARLGTVREVIGRALRGLAAADIIEFDRHHIVILDLPRLEEEAEA